VKDQGVVWYAGWQKNTGCTDDVEASEFSHPQLVLQGIGRKEVGKRGDNKEETGSNFDFWGGVKIQGTKGRPNQGLPIKKRRGDEKPRTEKGRKGVKGGPVSGKSGHQELYPDGTLEVRG